MPRTCSVHVSQPSPSAATISCSNIANNLMSLRGKLSRRKALLINRPTLSNIETSLIFLQKSHFEFPAALNLALKKLQSEIMSAAIET